MQNGTVHYYEIQKKTKNKKTKNGKNIQIKKIGETPTNVNTVVYARRKRKNIIIKHDIFFQFVRIYTCRVQFFGIL